MTVIVIEPVCTWLQPGGLANAILINCMIEVVLYDEFNIETPVGPIFMNWFAPVLILYVTMLSGVPVNVTDALLPAQMVAFPEIVTVGKGLTVIVITSVNNRIQLGVPADWMPTRVKVALAVKIVFRTAVPVPSRMIVWFGPLFILYVTVASGVPVKVMVLLSPRQIPVFVVTVTKGNGSTVIVAVPVKD